jgi:hypothetical protein
LKREAIKTHWLTLRESYPVSILKRKEVKRNKNCLRNASANIVPSVEELFKAQTIVAKNAKHACVSIAVLRYLKR